MRITSLLHSAFISAVLTTSASAFVPRTPRNHNVVPLKIRADYVSDVVTTAGLRMVGSPSPLDEEDTSIADIDSNALMVDSFWKMASPATMLLTLFAALPAYADNPDWGIFEGRTGSILHPIMMASLLVYSLSTALLGFQWRRQRTMGSEISDLRAQLPAGMKSKSDLEAAIKAATTEGGGSVSVSQLQAAIPIAEEIEKLQQERKDLAAADPREKHFGQGAILAFLGIAFAIEGPLNTYARTGKLFPGPHLYVGAALVVIWALAVATIPSMQKGNDTARAIHIGANISGLGLFVWQVTSGIPIFLKVLEKTSWP